MIRTMRLLPSLTLVLAFVATAASPAKPLAQWPHRTRGAVVAHHTRAAVEPVTIYRLNIARTELVALSKVQMVATAYTAHDYGCNGRTATGRRAGPGVVAVDPRVIPLGSHLYIPGYGFALAGDTGGDIRGNRVDLGFSSYGDAIRFGRREVTVYRLK